MRDTIVRVIIGIECYVVVKTSGEIYHKTAFAKGCNSYSSNYRVAFYCDSSNDFGCFLTACYDFYPYFKYNFHSDWHLKCYVTCFLTTQGFR